MKEKISPTTAKNRIDRADRKARRAMAEADVKRKTKAIIRHAYAQGATVREAADYGGIAVPTLYKWLQADPEWKELCERAKSEPVFKAKRTVVKNLDNPKHAKWFLEKKAPDEFGNVVTKRIEGQVNVNHKLEELSNDELMKIAYGDVIEAEIVDGNKPRKLDGGTEVIDGEARVSEETTGEEQAK